MCMSPSSLGNYTIYSTWCIMICLVITILSLLLFIQSLYSLSKLFIYLSLVLFLLLLVIITLDIIPTTIGTSKHQVNKAIYFPGAKPIQLHCSTACASTSTIHVHLHSWLGLITSEPKGLTKKSSQGENLFPCNKFISSCIIMCIDFVAMTCNILYCWTEMYRN